MVDQEHLPEELKGGRYYFPSDSGNEKTIKERMKGWEEKKKGRKHRRYNGGEMSRVYHQCHFCGGEVSEKKITVDHRWGEKLVTVIKNVPAGVC